METLIIVLVAFALLALFVIWTEKRSTKSTKDHEMKINRAESGKAKVLDYSYTNFRGRGQRGHFQAYKFNLEVSTAFKAPYKAEAVWNVYDMGAPNVQEGKEVDVKIDADNPAVIYPVLQGVEYSWDGAILEALHKKNNN